ncbi:MAG: protoheme IX farnesyltransferase [Puniceicoccaceae bacterium]|nr:MAG: protoheme IX farnesyltransferase [Puniceicoccaceae bacterium]
MTRLPKARPSQPLASRWTRPSGPAVPAVAGREGRAVGWSERAFIETAVSIKDGRVHFFDPDQGLRGHLCAKLSETMLMKTTLTPAVFAPALATPAGAVRALYELTKPRLAFFSILTALAAFAAAGPGGGPGLWLAAGAGIALAAGGALSFNQWLERRHDAVMARTRGRPLPAGRIGSVAALAWSLALSIGGVGLLGWLTTPAAAVTAAVIIILYGLVYTPLKRITPWATEIGSVSGALPPILGAAAAGNLGSPTAWLLAAVLLCWQMPHFYAIGWRYREDYRRAGFRLLPVVDATGRRTAYRSFAYSVLMWIVSVAPWALGWFGPWYGVIALIAGGGLVLRAGQMVLAADAEARDESASRLFFATILYLPLVLSGLLMQVWLG